MSNFCLVCNASCDGRLRNGIVACQACKSFFLRNLPSGVGLKCSTGYNNCFPSSNSIESATDGRRFRFICPKCRFRLCQEFGMNPPKTYPPKSETNEATDDSSLMPKISVGSCTKETLNSLIQVFMDINCATGTVLPGFIQEWNPQISSQQVAQCFIDNSDHVSRLFANFLKINPLYKRLSMADRCSTFFQCVTRLNRVFNAAPAAMNRNNFNRLQTLYPDFKVLSLNI